MSLTETLSPALPAGGEMVPTQPAPSSNPARNVVAALLGLGVAGLVGLLYADCVRALYSVWDHDDNYSHGFLVPLVSLWIGWEVLRRQGLSGQGATVAGLFWLVLGSLLHLWADVFDWPMLDFLALTALLYGVAVLAGGRRWAQGFLFPILFLFFMFPLSPVLLNRAAQWLQGRVASAATLILQLFVPAYQTGNGIHLPGQPAPLEVGAACSGLRQMVAFVALALLIAHYTRGGRLFRLAIVLAAVPVAVVANLLRVVLMAFLVLHFGVESISERKILIFGISYHTAWGLLTMAVGLVLFLLFVAWLNRAFPHRSAAENAGQTPTEPSAPLPILRAPISTALVARTGAAVVCLAGAVGAQLALDAHLRPVKAVVGSWNYIQQPLVGQADKGFPVSLGPWSGAEATPQPATVPTFTAGEEAAADYFKRADAKLTRTYFLPDSANPNDTLKCELSLVHFRTGEDRQHHPVICYSVAGCEQDPKGHDTVTMAGDGGPAQRFCFTKGHNLRYVFYWHYTFEPPDAPEWSWLQRLHARRLAHPSLTVQVSTDARTPEQLEQAAQFVRLVDRQLQAHLPPGARRGSDTLPIVITRQ